MYKFSNKDNFAFLAIFIVGFLTFGWSINSGFLLYDDTYNIVLNPFFLSDTVHEIWVKPYFGMYIPGIYTVWYGFWKIFDGQSWPFHTLNILLHSYNTLLLFLILRFVKTPKITAFLCVLLFEIHPLQVESVVWITEGRGLAAFSFSLSAIYIWLCGKRKPINEGWAFLLYVLSLIFKPHLAFLPFIIIFFRIKKPFRILDMISPLFALTVGIVLLLFTSKIQSLDSDTAINFGHRIIILLDHLGFILSKVLVPLPLIVDYGLTPHLLLKTNYWIIGLCGIIAATFLLFRFWKSKEIIGLLALSLLVLGWLPQSGLVSTGFQTYSVVADRYAYCILAALVLLVGRTIPDNKYTHWILALSVLILTTLSIVQEKNWKDDISLFQRSVDVQENGFIAQSNLGFALLEKNNIQEALTHFERAHGIIPRDLGPILGIMLSLTKNEDHIKSIDYGNQFLNSSESIIYNRNSVHLPKFYFTLGYNYTQKQTWLEAHKYFCLSQSHESLGPSNYGLEDNIKKVETVMKNGQIEFITCQK